jgi:hypothetical protein
MMIVPPDSLLSEPDELPAGAPVMVAYLAPPRPGEETPRVVRVNLSLVAEAMGFLAVAPVEREASADSDATSRLIGIQRNLRRNALADKAQRAGLVAEYAGERPAATLSDDDNNLPLA